MDREMMNIDETSVEKGNKLEELLSGGVQVCYKERVV